MNRRDWIRMVAAAAPSTVLSSHLAGPQARDVYLIVTDTPEQVIQHLRPSLKPDALVDVRRVSPSPQDITIVRSGSLVDPRVAPRVGTRVRDLLAVLRSRGSAGSHLVSIEPDTRLASDVVSIEQDSHILERIDRGRSYQSIEIAGPLGPTVFSLQDGRLSVVRASCRHELCRRSGPIRSGRIVCVPNRLVASVAGPRPRYDAITG